MNTNDIQNELKAAFNALSAMLVSGENVDLLAVARERLRSAYKLTQEKPAETEGENAT